MKNWRKNLKTNLLYIMGGQCAICGYNKCERALDFHHLDDEDKNFTLSHAFAARISAEEVISEVKKCVLLCSNCHRELHAGVHNDKTLISSFIQERYDMFFERRCSECGATLFDIRHTFCSKTCRGIYTNKNQTQYRLENSFWTNVDVVNLLSRHNGIMVRAAKEMGISDNAVKKRFKKVTNCNNWEEHLASLPKIANR